MTHEYMAHEHIQHLNTHDGMTMLQAGHSRIELWRSVPIVAVVVTAAG